ncbi:ABC transporter ATP-binding protein [Streptomyces sp. NP160]|uniref:ABC transporter ATP-binding protein n=1 Tax=Streptomyces sp. NP160 TaxID=2586637 RepID=UPI00111A4CCB|nr:ABC transporter ATP-binding protein [Streptomyces sp. NP160]TNM67672.1 ABC transporter ATP-binding protein [Streptomyces sp. NP160]
MEAVVSSAVSAPAQHPTGTALPGARGGGAAVPVRLEGVGRRFGDHVVLEGVDLDVAAGEVVALLGPSGCGKSTLLRAVAGLDSPDSGTVLLDGGPVRDHDPRCAVAFQEPRLLPWRTLAGNTALGLPRGTPRAEGRERVAALLDVVGLARFSEHRPRSVSGGMAQRAALARALARRPGVLVLDEPFAALDALTRLTMQDLLLEVLAATPTTVLLVTHDVDEALHLADRVVVLGRPDGAPPEAGAGVLRTTAVDVAHPRDRGDAHLASLRAELLELLGVPRA